MIRKVPKEFVLGAAMSAYQMEGAAAAGGRARAVGLGGLAAAHGLGGA